LRPANDPGHLCDPLYGDDLFIPPPNV
jgi:hypothetical protein